MLSSEQILEQTAEDGTIDVTEWPRVLESLLQRLHDIVYNEFPIPTLSPPPPPPPQPSAQPILDPEVVASTPPQIATSEADQSLPDTDELPSNSQSSTKENDAPIDIAAGRPPYPHGYDISESQKTDEMIMPPPQLAHFEQIPGTLPPDLLSMYQSSRRILQYDFAQSPPYTVQRLAEMVLRPKRHYRFLPAYLRALDRIVSVSSPTSDFPLPTLHAPLNGGFLTNGETPVNGVTEREGLGSDESLGGALLTPIPWLRNQSNIIASATAGPESQGELHSESTEMVDGPRGAGSIETVSVTVNGISSTSNAASQPSSSPIASPTLSEQSDASSSSSTGSTEAQLRELGGVTQGELLRQEQEAGVVPVNAGQPLTTRRALLGAGAVGREPVVSVPAIGESAMDEGMEEHPHARGPEVIGMEDMGPQPKSPPGGAVIDMEAAVGRGRSKSPQPPPLDEAPEAINDEMEDVELGEPGKPGQDPNNVETEVEKLREAMDHEEQAEAKDKDGDFVIGDADGKPLEEAKDEKDSDEKPDTVETTSL